MKGFLLICVLSFATLQWSNQGYSTSAGYKETQATQQQNAADAGGNSTVNNTGY